MPEYLIHISSKSIAPRDLRKAVDTAAEKTDGITLKQTWSLNSQLATAKTPQALDAFRDAIHEALSEDQINPDKIQILSCKKT